MAGSTITCGVHDQRPEVHIPIPNDSLLESTDYRRGRPKAFCAPGHWRNEIKCTDDIWRHWRHWIIVEKVEPAELGTLYPQFLGGERRCPPEDCGGFPGHYDFLDRIVSKQSKKRKAAFDWYGSPYDPDDMDERQILLNLKSIANPQRRGRSKAAKR